MVLAIAKGKVGEEIGDGINMRKYCAICEIYFGLSVQVTRCPCCNNLLRCPFKTLRYLRPRQKHRGSNPCCCLCYLSGCVVRPVIYQHYHRPEQDHHLRPRRLNPRYLSSEYQKLYDDYTIKELWTAYYFTDENNIKKFYSTCFY